MVFRLAKEKWSDEELIVAVYLYRYGYEELGLTYTKIADILGRSAEAIFMKLSNMLSVHQGKGGLKNTGKRDGEILNEYINAPKDELRKRAIGILFETAIKRNRTL